jgi:hypothetical protein
VYYVIYRTQLYTWAGQHIHSLPPGFDPLPKNRPNVIENKLKESKIITSIIKATNNYKNDDKTRSNNIIKSYKTIAMTEKNKYNDYKSIKKETTLKLTSFRNKLKQRLIEIRGEGTNT